MPKDGLKSTVLRAAIEHDDDPEDTDKQARDHPPVEQLTERQLVDRYDGLVGRVAQDIYDHHDWNVPFEDLRAYGFEGLLEAHDNYEPDRGVSFSTYAFYRIRGAIYDGCRDEGWSNRHQASVLEDLAGLNDHLADQADTRTNLPRAKTFEDSVSRIDRMVGDTVTVLLVRQLDLEELRCTDDCAQFDDVDRRQRLDLVADAIDQLDDNERDVVVRYHLEDESMSSIADDLDYSKGWISRVNSRAIDKIRNHVLSETEHLEPSTPGG